MAFGTSLHVAQALTDLAVAYKPSADGFIRDKFFPRKNVQHITDKLRQIDTANMLLLHDLKVGSDGRVPEVQYRLGSDITYVCVPFAAEAVVSDLDSGNADAVLQHEQRQYDQAMLSLTIALEKIAVDTLTDSAILTKGETVAAADMWDNYTSATSDPLADLLTACTQVRHNTGGKNPNRIVMEEFVWNKVQNHPNTIERVKLNAGPGAVLTKRILADILRVDESALIITSASYNSAQQNVAIAQRSFIKDNCVVAFVEDGGSNDYSLGHEFAYSGYGSEPVVVVKYRKEDRGILGSNIIRVGSIVDFKVTQARAAWLFKTVVDKTLAEYDSFLSA